MTTYIDWMIPVEQEVPEIFIKTTSTQAKFLAGNVPKEFENAVVTLYEPVCDHIDCLSLDIGKTKGEALEIAEAHKKWHEEGCPE